MTERASIDTGPLVGLDHDQDPHHARCRAALARLSPPLLTCWPVLTEAAWLLRKRPDGFRAIIDGFASGLFALLPLDVSDLAGIAAILARYETAGVQLDDDALAHLADREGFRTLFTTDRRDFSIIRLKRNRALKLIADIRDATRRLRDEVSGAAAGRWLAGLQRAVKSLESRPSRRPLAAESDKFPREVRELLYGRRRRGKYRILFEMTEGTVYVLHVRHSARDEIEP